jgi:hypothetical protein
MPILKLEIDVESLHRLAEIAVNERRPISLQAEVLSLKAIGRWPIPDHPTTAEGRQVPAETWR